MQTRPAVTLPSLRALSAVELEDFAVFDEDGEVDDAEAAGEFGVLLEVAVVAVDGDEEFRPQQVDHEALLFLAAVAADVDEAVRRRRRR